MKDRKERDLRALKQILKIWRASEKRKCALCDKAIQISEPTKVVVGANKSLSKYYHLNCYIKRLEEEVDDYKSVQYWLGHKDKSKK